MSTALRLPFYRSADEVNVPDGWAVSRIVDLYEQLPIGRRYDKKTSHDSGAVPVIDQSLEGVIGYHDDEPGVDASISRPVVTFANHTCAMRVMTQPFSVIQNVFPMIGKDGVCDTLYLYYATNGRQATEEYKGHHPAWRNSFVPLPSADIQQQVVDVLKPIDDLIENNRRRIELLESMARAIYREWFVHFRFPGHEDVPMVDSDLGPIPQGWVTQTLADVSEVVTRGIAPKYADDGEWVVLNQRCIRDERVAFGASRRQERPVSEAKRVRFGDVLINSTGVGTLGRVAIFRGVGQNVTVDSHVTIARPKTDGLNPWYGMTLLSLAPTFERLGAGSTGQTELSRVDVNAQSVLVPDSTVMAAFGSAVWPLLNEVDNALARNESLAAMRDLLLPKLVSGEIDVSGLDLAS